MKHCRPDYDRIQDPAGLIPEDEPVFLLRGQDVFAPETIRSWASRVAAYGGDPEIIKMAREHADRMSKWQRENASKCPDLPKENSDD